MLIATDIHVPSERLWVVMQGIKITKPDALIVSGDLTEHGWLGEAERLFNKLRQTNVRVVAVLGNHDLWASKEEGDSLAKIEKWGKLAEKYGVELLDVMGRTELGEYDVVGNVGWYDYSFAPGYTDFDYENCNPYGCSVSHIAKYCLNLSNRCDCVGRKWHNDCVYVKNVDSKGFARENKEKIRMNLRANRKAIVVTHHAPLKELVKPELHDFFNAYNGQDMSDVVFNGNYSDRLHVYGHLHDGSVSSKVETRGVTFLNAYSYQTSVREYVDKALIVLE
ncbi:MAG: metallophosphoesterase family protein [Thermoprotei archaeon]